MEKKKTMKVVPNAIRIATNAGNEYLFGSFIHRDEAFNAIEYQRAQVDEARQRKEDMEKHKSAQVGDMMVKNFRIANKIAADDIIKEMTAQPEKKTCCTCTII